MTPDFSKFATVGHSLGGLLAANIAALASESNLPRVRAVMSVEPGITESPINVPLADLKKIPADTLLLAVAGDQDGLVRDTDAKRIYYESNVSRTRTRISSRLFRIHTGSRVCRRVIVRPTAMNKDYDNGEGVIGGPAGTPDPIGDARVSRRVRPETMMVNALDYYGTWKLFDGLIDAAFTGKNREYALGNTPQQRFMGVWSDGVPVKELKVTDKP